MASSSRSSKSHNPSYFTDRFIRMDDLEIKVGLSRSQIYKLIQDEEFPRQLKIGPRISVWKESDIDKWMSEMDPIEHVTD